MIRFTIASFATAFIVLVIVVFGYYAKIKGILIPINTAYWSQEIHIDLRKEKVEFNITDSGLDWFAAIDGDMENPIPILHTKGGKLSIPNTAKKLQFCLRPGQSVTNAEILFQRIPGWALR